ncbi:hypothetical protein [Streptomyces sp. NBC_00728]|uniref:hypothetical protein n=1 Tax=Streptomyces sp. NBC_00728 TaxID=2903676 RepID=UPI0038678EAD
MEAPGVTSLLHVSFQRVAQVTIIVRRFQPERRGDLPVVRQEFGVPGRHKRGEQNLIGRTCLVDQDQHLYSVGHSHARQR